MTNVLMALGNAGIAGSELYALDLANRLKNNYEISIEFIFFRDGPIIEQCRKEGYVVILANKKPIRTLIKIFKSKKHSVVHAHQPMAKFICSISYIICKIFYFYKQPFIITIHTAPIGIYNYYNLSGKKIRAVIAYLRTYLIQIIAIMCAQKVFAVSNHLVKYYPQFCRPKIKVTFNHIPIELETYSPKIIKGAVSESFLYCGGSDPNKGYSIIKELVTSLTDVSFILVGRYSEVELKYLQKPNVTVLGLIQPQQIWDYMKNVGAVLMPSKYETFGRIALEAAFIGCPIILSKIEGLTEIFNEEDGFFCNPNDIKMFISSIRTIQKDPDQLRIKVSDIQKKVKTRFVFPSAARDLLVEYDKIVET